MAEYLEKAAVIKAIHDEIYSGGKWSGGWYEKSEEQAEKDFTKRINAITPVKGEWEVYEILHGEWEGTKKYRCPRCKYKVGVFNTNFCPECGLKMSDGKSWERSNMRGETEK